MTSPRKQTVVVPGRFGRQPTDFAMECSSESEGEAEGQAAGGKGSGSGLGQRDPAAVGRTTPGKQGREGRSKGAAYSTRPQTSRPTATHEQWGARRKSVKFKSATASSDVSGAVAGRLRVGPLVCIEKYEERTDQYGVGYVLSNGRVGILFNDRTSMVTKDNRSEVVLVGGEKSGLQEYDLEGPVPDDMAAKVKCFKKFKRRNQAEEEKSSSHGQAGSGSDAPILANKWKTIDGVATLFRLTDHTEIFFTADGTSIVLSYDRAEEHGEYEFGVLTYIQSQGRCVNLHLEDVMELDEEEEIY